MISIPRSMRAILLATGGLALAVPAQAAGPYEFVTGGGITSFQGGSTIGFTAHNGPNGPSGHATIKNESLAPDMQDRRGHVYCLRVEGNRAIFGIEDYNEQTGNVVRRQFFVEDNGNPKKGQPVDRIGGANDPNCTADPQTYTPTGLVISNGNIQVRDA